MIYIYLFLLIIQEGKNIKFIKGTNIFGNLKEMNLTAIEKKNINKKTNVFDKNKINLMEPKKTSKDNKIGKKINIRRIEPKNFGMKSTIGLINSANKNNVTTTISLSSKLSDISEKLDKYEHLINKLGKDFQ